MLEDMEENEFSNYVEQVGKELGLLLGAGNQNISQERGRVQEQPLLAKQ